MPISSMTAEFENVYIVFVVMIHIIFFFFRIFRYMIDQITSRFYKLFLDVQTHSFQDAQLSTLNRLPQKPKSLLLYAPRYA